jgi:hypothetical protein
MKILSRILKFFSRPKKLTFDEVRERMEHLWDNQGRKVMLCDFFEEHIGDYENLMRRQDYETLKNAIIFDWGDLGNDCVPEYLGRSNTKDGKSHQTTS